ncbi:MAG TPA: permease-like cell division protein FtsX [Legionellaceae bacterium]|nr:permease-like cell division protein FtsX [Legionellaceae bacterium]
MLKKDSPLRVAHQEALKQSIRFLRLRPWSNFMTILMIAVSLMLVALTWMATHQLSALGESWKNSEHISLYLQPTLQTVEQERFMQKIRAMPEVAKVTFTSAEEGLRLLTQQEGMQDLAQYLPNNPLPAMLEITLSNYLQTPEAVRKVFQILKAFPEVEDAKFDLDWMGRLYSVMGFLHQVSRFLMLLLIMTVMLVIGNTLRLIIHHRHEEIQILQFLGAADKFIMRPFLYSGLGYGFLAACLAVLLVDTFILMLRTGLNQWAEMYQMHFSLPLMSVSLIGGLILIATTLGWMSARITVSRYL